MRTKRIAGTSVALSGALLLTACGGGDGGGTAAEGGGDGTFSVYIGEPENPLLPGNTGETEGGQVVDALWTGLVEYDRDWALFTDWCHATGSWDLPADPAHPRRLPR